MSILEKIVADKKIEVQQNKNLYPEALLEKAEAFKSPTVSLKKYLEKKDKNGLIAEFKRKSPSKGIINKYANVEDTSIAYMQAGASAISVLTDEKYFGGKNKDLITVRHFNYCPVLRKDFMVDPYQIIEARSIGADAILLIAAVLTAEEIKSFSELANSLGMESILEIHDVKELDKGIGKADIIGFNNRNLHDFSCHYTNAIKAFSQLPAGLLKIAESGIHTAQEAFELQAAGYDGFLIGQQFMEHSRPGLACAQFIQELNKLKA